MTTVLKFTQREKCDAIEKFKLHCSIEEFDALAAFIESATLAQFVAVDGPAVEIRVLGETE